MLLPPAGWFPLLILDVEETLSEAREKYYDHPELAALIKAACARVGSHYEDYSSALHEARAWTIECAEEAARRNNISLVPREPPDHSRILALICESNFAGAMAKSRSETTFVPPPTLYLPAPEARIENEIPSQPPAATAQLGTLEDMLSTLHELQVPSADIYHAILKAIKALMASAIADGITPA